MNMKERILSGLLVIFMMLSFVQVKVIVASTNDNTIFSEDMLYRARLSNGTLYIERSVNAGYGDYDSDNDGWAILGKTSKVNSEEILKGIFINDNVPYVLIESKEENDILIYRVISPILITKVKKFSLRYNYQVDTFTVGSDVDENQRVEEWIYSSKQVADSIVISRKIFDSKIKSNNKYYNLYKEFKSKIGNYKKLLNEYDEDGDGWADLGIYNYSNVKLQSMFKGNLIPFVVIKVIEDNNIIYKIITPESMRRVEKGQERDCTVLISWKGGVIEEEEEIKDETTDTDEDSVPDYIEDLFGCDNNKSDTDGDGLSDYDEIFVTHTDPTLVDTDENGISDADEDTDGDGITNIDEYKYGTRLDTLDTDNDGLSDGEEVNNYGTDPTLYDTDGDGLSDGDEIKLGLNPLKEMTDGATLDSERKFYQDLDYTNIDERLLGDGEFLIPSLAGNVTGIINNNVSIEYNPGYVFDENRAIVGNIINIETSYTGELDLKLSYDYSNLLSHYDDSYIDRLVICRFDGEDIIPCDTVKEGNKITANINTAGTYLVMNIEEFLRHIGVDVDKDFASEETDSLDYEGEISAVMENESEKSNELSEEWYSENYILVDSDGNEVVDTENIEELETYRYKLRGTEYFFDDEDTISTFSSISEAQGQADIAFVIDTTGSMGGVITNVANNINDFVDRLTSEYNIKANFALVDYRDITVDGVDSTKVVMNGVSNWFSSVSSFKNEVNSLYVNGGGDWPESAIDGLEVARNLGFRESANKFIILVTDANYKVDNNYGIASMDEMISLLEKDGISTSVVSDGSYESIYKSLYEYNDGVFANIYGNFSEELLKIADKIGEKVNEGTWVLLNDYQYIKLNGPVSSTEEVHSDGDGISDYEELGELINRPITTFVKIMCSINGIPYELYKGKESIEVYNYISNPILDDTDYDGRNDNIETSPKDNTFNKKMKTVVDEKEYNSPVTYTVDYRNFFRSNMTFNPELNVLSSIFASSAYDGTRVDGYDKIGFMQENGLENVTQYKLSDYESDQHISEIIVGNRVVTYNGVTKNIVSVMVRGTNGTDEEWGSNFDIGADTDTGEYDDWLTPAHHKGFDIAANRLMVKLNEFLTSTQEDINRADETVIWITGHSRGAGIANLMSYYIINNESLPYDVYAYKFAAPNTTTSSDYNDSKYDCIFNTTNKDDLVPYLPITENLGFNKYGKIAKVSIQKNYEKEWEDIIDVFDYNNDRGGVQYVLDSLASVVNSRSACYIYTCSCHGDGSNNKITATNKGMSYDSREEAIFKYLGRKPKFATEPIYYRLERFDGGIISGWDFTMCQTPAYFMQCLGAMMVNINSKPGIIRDIASEYYGAMKDMAVTAISGAAHPHFVQSYYVLANHLKSSDYK